MGENRKGWVRRLPSFKTFAASILPILLTFFATPIFPSTPIPSVGLMEPWRRKWTARGVDGPRGSKTALIRAGLLEYFIDWAFVERGGEGGCSEGLECEGKTLGKTGSETRNETAELSPFFLYLFSPCSFSLLSIAFPLFILAFALLLLFLNLNTRPVPSSNGGPRDSDTVFARN